MRADALRNIDAILEAGHRCLAADPDASVGDIAKAAGVGRVTLYGHFANRAELVEAVVQRALARFDAALASVDFGGDPRQALVRLVEASWRPTAESANLLVAAERALPPEKLLATHEGPAKRVVELLERGREAGAFRTDLPTSWLVAMFHATVHAAANELAAGNLDPDAAAPTIATTLLAAFTPPTPT
ncbi:MAG TPA: TetR/AcrR family transcriptional regulator [Acidimicrobiales bacterium]